MSDLKKMYATLAEDPFPGEMTLRLGDAELRFVKRTWTIDGAEKGLRYGENPDQPAAIYELRGGGLNLGGVAFRGPGQALVASMTEEHLLQSGKHPGKINLTDVDAGITVLQYLSAKPAVVILKHNNPCGAAGADAGLAQAVDKAVFSDRIAAVGGTRPHRLGLFRGGGRSGLRTGGPGRASGQEEPTRSAPAGSGPACRSFRGAFFGRQVPQ
jgi:phosphoribosylaminoimidazolecarboxamide formyltransferase/IMP cyclohydrolase